MGSRAAAYAPALIARRVREARSTIHTRWYDDRASVRAVANSRAQSRRHADTPQQKYALRKSGKAQQAQISGAYKANMSEPASSPSQEQAGPHLEVLDRVRNIPVVQSAIEKTGSTYSYVKDSHHLINWALNFAEAGLHYATATAAPIAAPIVKKFEGPISSVDQKLCQGLDIVEQKAPIVKQPPQQIYDAAKNVMNSSLQPTIEKLTAVKATASNQATALKDISVSKANEILNNQYGVMAVQGVDNTSVLVNRLLDHYFPPVEGEQQAPAPVSADENKVLHAVQTIGQLSTKTANRVYHSVVAQLRTVKKEDVANYISSVVSILHLTNYLNLGQRECNTSGSNTSTSSTTEKDDKSKAE